MSPAATSPTLSSEQTRTVATVWVTYALFYLGRVNLSPVLPALAIALGVSRAEVGILGTAFFWVYAAGQFINGELGSHFSPRRIVAFGLLVIALVNLLFSIQTSLLILVILWAINGFAQSMGWPPMIRIIAERLPRENLRRVSTILPISYILGVAITWTFVGWLITLGEWQIAFWVPGLLMFGVLAFWWFSNIDAPKAQSTSFKLRDVTAEIRSIGFVLVTGVMMGFVNIGVIIWLPAYITDTGLVPEALIGFIAAMTQVVSIMGFFLARYLVTRWESVFLPTITLLIAAASALVVAIITPPTITLVAITVLAMAINAANGLLVSSFPLMLSSEGRASSVAGTINTSTNFGGGIAGVAIGAVVDAINWNAAFALWAILLTLAIAMLWHNRAREYKQSEQNHHE